MPLSAGTRLGPYEILAPIGAGGMGEVYKARDTRLDRIVAIKTSHEQFSERFELEARAVAALNHPNICTLFDVGPDYLVMEYIEGAPIKGPLPTEEAVRLAIQIAAALEEAHRKGIIHRDLKPSNILVTATGVKLLDFGLAKREIPRAPDDATATLTQAGTVLGTIPYMSPEQAEGKPADARSDIFSFGLVLYEMLSGRRAFQQESQIAILAAILHKEPPPLSAPSLIVEVVVGCLRKNPTERFQSVAELRHALERAKYEGDEDIPSIAVLPFANMSGDKDNEYFSDGLAEEIINALVQLPRLKITARTSAFAFKGKNEDIRKIGEALGVAHVLEGSVRKAGSRIRVTAQLISVADGCHLWSQRFDRELTDIFAVQDEISLAIVGALKIQVEPVTHARSSAVSGYLVNPEAYEACLKARFFWNRRTRDDLYQALEFFSISIEKDRDYAPAFAGLADTYLVLLDYRYIAPNEALALATAAAVNALRLDEQLPDAHTSLAHAKMHALDWDGAEQEFRRAIQLGPGYAVAHFYYANVLACRRRFEEAISEARAALELDPVSATAAANLAILHYNAGHYDEAIESSRKALEMEPNLAYPYDDLGRTLLEKGLFSEAIAALERAVSLSNRGARFLSSLGYGYGVAGRKDLAREILAELIERSKQGYVASSDFAFVNVGLGERDQAIQWLERACKERDSHLPSLAIDPRLVSLRRDPRFDALLKRVGLKF